MSDRPTVAVVFLQPHCNMKCSFCVTEDGFDLMSFEQATALLEHLRALSVRSLVIGGGEPFAWPHDVVRLAGVAKSLGFATVQVGTNGIALREGFEYVDSIDRYVLPLESVRPEPHNQMRIHRDGHHATIMDRLATLKRAGKSVTLSTVITAVNVDEIYDIADFLREYARDTDHVHAWHLYQFIPTGRGGGVNASDLEVPGERHDEIVTELQAMDLPFRIYRRTNMYQSSTVDFFWSENGEIKRGSAEWG